MNMLSEMFGGMLPDKEKLTHDTVQTCLENVAEELGCNHSEFFIMIKPKSEDFEMSFYIYKLVGGAPKLVREITLKEILDIEET